MNVEINAQVHAAMPWAIGYDLPKSVIAKGRNRGRATLFHNNITKAKRKGEKVISEYMQKYR